MIGSSIRPDGMFGKGIEAAARQFQERRGLKADGIVGRRPERPLLSPEAWDVLRKGVSTRDSRTTLIVRRGYVDYP
jgi:peptidoglycan hydrolase-like protein with peptidoglycan-binding domain